MHIGIDGTCWSNRRGFGRFTRELLRAVAALDTGDEYVIFADRQTADSAAFPAGWRVVIGETTVAATTAAAADGRRSIRDVWTMRRVVALEPLDVMFFPAVYSYFPIGGRTPCLVTFHDVIAETLGHLVFHTRRSRWFWQLKSWLAVRRADCVLTVSQASKQGLIERFGLTDDRVRVVSEAPSDVFTPADRDSDEHRAALGRCGLEADERFLLYVGGISPHKNLSTLIEAFAKLVSDSDLGKLRLVLVGDYAGDVFRTCHQQLVDRARALGADDRVHFAGYVADDDLVHLYSAATAFVFPSYLEGFGLPAAEAMACGAPVVASDRGSLPEVLDGPGELFDPHDADALLACLRRVVGDVAVQDELRRRSLARAQHLSWERAARQLVDVLREVGGRTCG